MSELLFDAAIVGAGPAGCSAAITLARRGARVALFEARRFPHDKLCGEFLSPECDDLLGSLDVHSRIHALRPAPIHRVLLTTNDGTAWETCLLRAGWGLSRSAFDAALAEGAEAAGAQMAEETSVVNIRGGLREGFELETARGAFRARVVIAAHGKRAALDRALKRDFLLKPQPFVAFKAHFHGPALHDRVELHAFPGGYCGLAEIEGNCANVCLLVRESVFRAFKGAGHAQLNAFLDWMQSQNERLRAWLERAERIDEQWLSIAQVPFMRKRVVERDILMAGDAGSLIAPLAGDGIAMALRSGILAAEQSGHYLASELDAPGLLRSYSKKWEREFGAQLRLGRLLQPILLEPRLAPLGLRVVNAIPALG